MGQHQELLTRGGFIHIFLKFRHTLESQDNKNHNINNNMDENDIDNLEIYDIYSNSNINKSNKTNRQAGAELGQAKVMLDDIVVIVVEVVVKAMVEVEVQLLFRVGGRIKRN